jgi:hypothetical protein
MRPPRSGALEVSSPCGHMAPPRRASACTFSTATRRAGRCPSPDNDRAAGGVAMEGSRPVASGLTTWEREPSPRTRRASPQAGPSLPGWAPAAAAAAVHGGLLARRSVSARAGVRGASALVGRARCSEACALAVDWREGASHTVRRRVACSVDRGSARSRWGGWQAWGGPRWTARTDAGGAATARSRSPQPPIHAWRCRRGGADGCGPPPVSAPSAHQGRPIGPLAPGASEPQPALEAFRGDLEGWAPPGAATPRAGTGAARREEGRRIS